MNAEEKAKGAVQTVKQAANSPLFAAMPAAKKAVLELAEAVELLAHEVEILKQRAGHHSARLVDLEKGGR